MQVIQIQISWSHLLSQVDECSKTISERVIITIYYGMEDGGERWGSGVELGISLSHQIWGVLQGITGKQAEDGELTPH